MALQERIDDAIEELRNFARENRPVRANDLYDEIGQIADSSVPIYTGDILQCALDDFGLATSVPELGPAFDGENTAVNLIASNIYERISNALHGAVPEIIEEMDVPDTDEEDDESAIDDNPEEADLN